jgi:enterochelin esterase family protein
MNRWGGSQFIDSAATGRYQSYLADEVVPFVDSHYRSLPVREGRAVIGRSSGGFGALRMGIDRPDVFAAIGSCAGDSAFEASILPDLTRAAIAYDRAGGLAAFINRFESDRARVDFNALMLLAYSAAYAPAPEAGFPFCELPVEPHSGALREAAFARFLAHDPIQRVLQNPDALRSASLVYLDAGDRDEHGLQFGARRLAALLSERALPVHHEEFEGGHRGTAHRYEVAWPLLISACARANAG